MFNRLTNLFKNKVAASAKSRRTATLQVEAMEERSMMTANYFILDFTPDNYQGSLADTFAATRTSQGYAPNFLDFNGDRKVNTTDVQLAAQQIAGKVASIFTPFVNNKANNLTIYYNDVTSNTNWGTQWLNYGRSRNDVQVSVMNFGGFDRSGSTGIAGRAPLAGEGQNIEGYGNTYTRGIANFLMKYSYSTKADFVNIVGGAAAHELGHMMGLRHAVGGSSVNIMNPTVPNQNPQFVSANYRTENGTIQNAYRELDASFQSNQRQVYGSVTGQYAHFDGPMIPELPTDRKAAAPTVDRNAAQAALAAYANDSITTTSPELTRYPSAAKLNAFQIARG